MRRIRGIRLVVLLAALAAMVAVPALQAAALGGMEFGLGVPISTSFSLTSMSYALDAYLRLAGSFLAWEAALQTSMGFGSLYLRNTIAGVGALHVALGAVTNLLPYFGSTYFTLGLGLTLGSAFVLRATLSIAASVSGYGVYWFPELRVQLGIDP